MKPGVTAAVAASIERLGGKPFLTGSSTLYRGMFEYAEELGLGSREYELVELR